MVIVQRESASTTTEATYLLFKDHLGSVFTTLATTGEIISQQLFSAFGQTRTIYTAGGVALGSMLPPTEQGFTGHRQMDALGIVHMKGRIYDPTLGRFLQADPFVQEPKNSQNYNRYSYVLNNSMSYTDPSGYFFSKLWEKIKPIIGVVVVAVLYAYCPACATYFASSWYGAATAGAIAGGVNAGFNGGNILTGALRGAVAAAAFYGVGEAFSGMDVSMGTSGYYSKVFMHGITGGVMNVLSGGKFANGAITGAFSRLFNDEMHHQSVANRVANEVSAKGRFASKGEADWIYQNNSDPNLSVDVDANKLTVELTSDWSVCRNTNHGMCATGRVTGSDYAVHGQVTVRARKDGTFGIYNQQYDNEMHPVNSPTNLFRNIATMLGRPSGGWMNTSFWTKYQGNTQIIPLNSDGGG